MTLSEEVLRYIDGKENSWLTERSQLITSLEKANADYALLDKAKTTEIDDLKAKIQSLEEQIEQLKNSPELNGWKLIYSSDLTKDDGWTKNEETQSNDNSRNLRKNAVFGPSGLVIYGRRESGYNRPYTTADVLGKHISVPTYFRAEVDAILPTEYAMWPAPLWFRPLSGPNASDGEIDVAETWTGSWKDSKTFGVALHPAYGSGLGHVNAKFDYSKLPNPDPAAIHTYAVEKTKGSIKFWCDGVFIKEWKTGSPAWFDSIFEVGKTWYPRITLQIGGTGSPFEPEANWKESKMIISGLRIYEPDN